MSNIYESCVNLVDIINDITMETARLEKLKDEILQEEVDINHHIELHELNEKEGYKACLDLKNCLQHRREVKNQLIIADSLKEFDLEGFANAIDRALAYYNKKKLYTPRVRTDLFPEVTGYVPRTEFKVVGNINKPNEEVVEEKREVKRTPVTQLVTAKKGKNYKHFPNLEEAVKFVASHSGHCANEGAWEDLMRTKLLKAVKNRTEFCGYRWTIAEKREEN